MQRLIGILGTRSLTAATWLFVAALALAACGGKPTDPAPPVIAAQPQPATVPDGEVATFSVAATTSDGSPLSYQWSKDGVAVAGATGTSYTTPPVAPADSGAHYSVLVSTGNGGSAVSNSATLTVTLLTPSVVTVPADVSAPQGSSAHFAVVATGSMPLNYQWLRDGAPIVGANGATLDLGSVQLGDDGARIGVTVSNAAGSVTSAGALLTVTTAAVPAAVGTPPASVSVSVGQSATFTVVGAGTAPLSYQWLRDGQDIAAATAAQYTTPATTLGDDGSRFSVRVGNAAGSVVSAEAVLTVLPARPAITQQPASLSVVAGSAATFQVAANGEGTLTYQWQRGGAPIAGATSAVYTLAASTLGDNGASFSVEVGNSGGRVTSEVATLTVTSAAIAPSIALQPQPQTVAAGQSATFTVGVDGTPPFSYQWQRNGADIAGAVSGTYSTPATVLADSGATFRVVVGNSTGTRVTSSAALLTVNASGPTITSQPIPASVLVGRPAGFSVTATTSNGPLSYQWRRNGADIAGATSFSYSVARTVFADDNANFSVLVHDTQGSVLSDVVPLRVAPVEVEHVMHGQSGLVSRNADGSVWLNWNAPGTTATTLSLTPVLLRDAGGLVLTGFDAVAAGKNHALAVDAAGVAWAWGTNTQGGLGNGGTTGSETFVPAPMQGAGGAPLAGVAAVQAGWDTSYTRMADGTLNAFGSNGYIGVGVANGNSTRAAAVLTAPGVRLTDVSLVVTGSTALHAMALRGDGTLWAWGRPACTAGAPGCLLGDGATNFSDYALQVKKAGGVAIVAPRGFAVSRAHSVVVQADGTVVAWGANASGELGDGTTTARGTATLVRAADSSVFGNVIYVVATTASAAQNGCTVLLREDGSVWAVGDNSLGCLGDGLSANRATPAPVVDANGIALTGVTEIAAGWYGVVIAKKADGSFWVWGTVKYGFVDQETWRSARPLTGFMP